MCGDVHVHHARRLVEHVVVEGRLLHTAGLERAHHGRHLALEKHEVAHRHRRVRPRGLERDPRAERQRGLERHAAGDHGEVAPREGEAHHAAGLAGARPAERFSYAGEGRLRGGVRYADAREHDDAGEQDGLEPDDDG